MPPTQLAYPSPKRKREQPPPAPLLNTALRPASTPPRGSPALSAAPDSPRNAVADQLRGMTLVATSAIPMSPLTPTDDVIRKKPKLQELRVDSSMALQLQGEKHKGIRFEDHGYHLDTLAIQPGSDALKEVPETPPTQPRMLPDISSFAQPTTFESPSGMSTFQVSLKMDTKSRMQNRMASLHQPKIRSPSPPPSALTWQDSEITGHLVGPATDPDDDGTGLNGIGFKPTPAIAYARSQKRRQQLNEWKARETREARAKRQERRRRGVGGTASRETTVERDLTRKEGDLSRRTVKFAI